MALPMSGSVPNVTGKRVRSIYTDRNFIGDGNYRQNFTLGRLTPRMLKRECKANTVFGNI